ncbi:lactate racemase domain-containing protein [Candidatus Bipolaricaulota bacterium]
MHVRMLWKAWYGDEELVVNFPDGWDVQVARMQDAPDMEDAAIDRAFDNTIGSGSIEELSRGKRSVAIAVDDLTRPTQAARLIPPLLRRLEYAGIRRENIVIISALGGHRPMTQLDFEKKLGPGIVAAVMTRNHNLYGNLVEAGATRRGVVTVNRFFAEADVKIGVGCVCPHDLAGFSGGAKIVLPGVAGIDTLEANHRPASVGDGDKSAGVGSIEGNETRKDMEDFARKINLDLVVNVVVNSTRGIAGTFVGHVVEAHREAVALARQVYATRTPEEPVDIAVLNAYPKDTELNQSLSAFNVLGRFGEPDFLTERGTIVIIAASSEGRGVHVLYERGMKLHRYPDESPKFKGLLQQRHRIIILSPTVHQNDVLEWYPKGTLLARTWDDVLSALRRTGARPSVAVFPCSTIQIPRESGC